VRTLLLGGIATNVCVESTARQGYMMDYQIQFVADCCAAYSLEEHEAALRNIRQHFGEVVTTQEVLDAWAEATVAAGARAGI
jgi:ureidoacrylate peracid hydrolase